MMRWQREALAVVVVWCVGVLASVGLLAVVAWAVVRLVVHFTRGG